MCVKLIPRDLNSGHCPPHPTNIEIYGFLFNFLFNFQVILFLSIKRERKVIPIVCVNKDEVGVRSKGIIDKGKS